MKPPAQKRPGEQGYMLLTLMLFVALLAVASLGWIEKVDFQVKRDREEELIHRGVQYSRAIKHYVKKFGRYPSRIEDLEKTSNIRFLRKRYKDPITGKDFKLLRVNDVQISFSPGAASGMAPGAAGGLSAAQPGAPGALNLSAGAVSPGMAGPSSIPGNPQSAQQDAPGDNPDSSQTAQGGGQGGPDTDESGSSNQGSRNGIANGQTFGGFPIVGVASTSKEKTIREFNKKDHYNQWQFIYDPTTDRGGLLTTPNQPAIQGATSVNQMNNGQSSGFGNPASSSFGQPSGLNSPQSPQSTPQPSNQQP
jgi:type II secretory pathway pseudopilin PulG